MPVLNSKYSNVKVYRPKGTKYAEGSATIEGDGRTRVDFLVMKLRVMAVERALERAYNRFREEFGRLPDQHSIIEADQSHDKMTVTVYELPDTNCVCKKEVSVGGRPSVPVY